MVVNEVRQRAIAIESVARNAGLRANSLSISRIAGEVMVPIAFAIRGAIGWERAIAVRVVSVAQAALVAAHRVETGEPVEQVYRAIPRLHDDGIVLAVIDHLLSAVVKEWPEAGQYACALAALVAMAVADRIENMKGA